MSLHREYDEPYFTDTNYEEFVDDIESTDDVDHKRQVRRMLEERLERKRLKEELDDELEGEFNWDDFER